VTHLNELHANRQSLARSYRSYPIDRDRFTWLLRQFRAAGFAVVL